MVVVSEIKNEFPYDSYAVNPPLQSLKSTLSLTLSAVPGISPQRCAKVCEHAIVEVAHFGIYSSRIAIARPSIE